MKAKRFIAVLLCVVMLVSCMPLINITVAAEDENEGEYIEVYTVEDLYNIRNDLSANYILMNDIDLTEDTALGGAYDYMGHGWNPIGSNDCYSYSPFSGVFEGNGYSIIGMRIEIKSGTIPAGIGSSIYVGLFSELTGSVRNLNIIGLNSTTSSVKANVYVGALAGKVDGAAVESVHVDGKIIASNSGYNQSISSVNMKCYNIYSGGLAGICTGSIFNYTSSNVSMELNCLSSYSYSNGAYTHYYYGEEYGGGIAGFGNNFTITNSYNTGNITADSKKDCVSYCGGIIGRTETAHIISNCFNSGNIETSVRKNESGIAGILGYNYSSDGTVTCCYNTGIISSPGKGIYTGLDLKNITDCYYASTSGNSSTGATSLSDAQMMIQSMYSGLDFDNVWVIIPDSAYKYPQLRNNIYDDECIVSSISMSSLPTKLSYLEGKDNLNVSGGKLTIEYKDGTSETKTLTRDMVRGFDNTKTGEQVLTVNFGRMTTMYTITVVPKTMTGISVNVLPTKSDYLERYEELDVSGGELQLIYDNGTKESIPLTSAAITGFNNTKTGENVLTAVYNNFTTTFSINIVPKSISEIEMSALPRKLTYLEAKDTLSTVGGQLLVKYNNGASDTVALSASMVSGFDNTRVGVQTLTVTYNGFTTEYDVDIIAKTLTGIDLFSAPYKISYIESLDNLDLSGAYIRLNYDNGTSEKVAVTDGMVFGFDNRFVGENEVTVTYEEFETTFTVNIIEKSVSKIEIYRFPDKLTYLEAKDNLEVQGGKILVTYNNGSEDIFDITSSMVSGFRNTVLGQQTLTVKYADKKTTYEVEVIAKSIVSIEMNDLPSKLTYLEGKDNLNVIGGRIKVYYDNDTTSLVSLSTDMIRGFDNTVIGNQTLIVTYEGFETCYEIEVIGKKVVSISLNKVPSKTSYEENTDSLDTSGGLINVKFDNGSEEIVGIKSSMITGFNNTKTGRVLLTVSYGGKTTSYYVEVVHKFRTEIKEPTCTEDGYNNQICIHCGYTKSTEVPSLGHDYVNHSAKSSSCQSVGWEAYQTCSRCDYTTYVEIPATDHVKGSAEVISNPTCTETGLTKYKCTKCKQYVDSWDEISQATGHEYINHSAKEATCTETGWEAYQTCAKCDYTSYKETAALGHKIVEHAKKDPTNISFGWEAYQTCERCDYTTYVEIPALAKIGWNLDDNGWFYIKADGSVAINEWIKDANGWQFCGKDTYLVYNQSIEYASGWRLVGNDGYWVTKTGWNLADGDWYYVQKDGYLATNGWMKDSKGWCYLDAKGKMMTNSVLKDSVGWCMVDSSGYWVTKEGWKQIGSDWYYVKNGGYLATNGWMKDSKGWCYLDAQGKMMTNTSLKDSKGWCLVDASGYWVTKEGWKQIGPDWYYVQKGGYLVTNGWMKDSKGWCYLDAQGKMFTDLAIKDSHGWCLLDKSGYWVDGSGIYIVEKSFNNELPAGKYQINSGYIVVR